MILGNFGRRVGKGRKLIQDVLRIWSLLRAAGARSYRGALGDSTELLWELTHLKDTETGFYSWAPVCHWLRAASESISFPTPPDCPVCSLSISPGQRKPTGRKELVFAVRDHCLHRTDECQRVGASHYLHQGLRTPVMKNLFLLNIGMLFVILESFCISVILLYGLTKAI